MNYIDLSNKSFELAVDATAAATNRVLDYVKSSFEVASKPYAATTPEAFVTESIDRTSKLVALRETYLKETAKHAAAVGSDVLANAKAWQDTNVDFVAEHIATAGKN